MARRWHLLIPFLIISLLVDLMAHSSTAQRLLKKIGAVRKDFAELKCLQSAGHG